MAEVRYTTAFQKALDRLPVTDRQRIEAAAADAARAWGDPHRHSGVSIRCIRSGIYEARSGLRLRLLFLHEQGELVFFLFGDHRTVQNFIRNF